MSSARQQLAATSAHKFVAAARHQHQAQHHEPGCGFCKRNREPSQVYLSHKLKDEFGKVTCPQLSRHICELCGATGPEAHTRSYCPQVVRLREQQKARERERKNSANSSASSGLSGASEPRRGQAALAHNNNNSTSRAVDHEPPKGLGSSVSNAAGNEDEEEEEEEEDYTIQCGMARVMSNMGTVSHTRYNSAGRLRNPHKFKSQQVNNNDPMRNCHRQSSYQPHGHQQSNRAPGGGAGDSWRVKSSDHFKQYRQ